MCVVGTTPVLTIDRTELSCNSQPTAEQRETALPRYFTQIHERYAWVLNSLYNYEIHQSRLFCFVYLLCFCVLTLFCVLERCSKLLVTHWVISSCQRAFESWISRAINSTNCIKSSRQSSSGWKYSTWPLCNLLRLVRCLRNYLHLARLISRFKLIYNHSMPKRRKCRANRIARSLPRSSRCSQGILHLLTAA